MGDTPVRWTFDVEYQDASVRTDYGTGIEYGAEWHWAIYDGPDELTDVVLSGVAEGSDPTEHLVAICAAHNRELADTEDESDG